MLAAIVGMIVAFALSNFIFQRGMNEMVQREMTKLATDYIRFLENMSREKFEVLTKGNSKFGWYDIHIYNEAGERISQRDNQTDNQKNVRFHAEPAQVRLVLAGQQFRSEHNYAGYPVIGMPFKFGGKKHAFFIEMLLIEDPIQTRFIITILLVSLAAGSLCILIAARFIVLPLNKMTEATKRMARGDFETELQTKRQDEIGILANSFNEMARELRQLEQMRQDFVSNVSHEIQSPLTSIYGFAKALKSGVIPESEQGRYLQIIMTESERMSRLSDNLLQLASLESDHHPFDPRPVNLDTQLRKILVALEPQWTSKQINVDLELEPVTINADEDQMNLVWTNIISNSIKFTPEAGVLRIKVSKSLKHAVIVSISDTGIGIPPEDLKRVFDRFYKADRSRRRHISGSGLGLAIVKKIVSLHKGIIYVESELGKGTTVTVRLPLPPWKSNVIIGKIAARKNKTAPMDVNK
ncbi:HAMP domain-containing sensor histidine kinase [Paenibacillus sp. 481]|uniref:HAMP domain-containing sensor histidine kinase n=1 Tax=Paenibacillus sp. 481 TaxID=2835869 RepID=UPI001E5B4B37|nr:HAMP domain-containing sensor histidine kinase [Paenibacillus sp. 481]